MSATLIRATRRMAESLQNETTLASLGALGDLAAAAEAKKIALEEFTEACASHGPMTAGERVELRRLLAAADENAIILEAVSNTLRDLTKKVRAAAATIADPGTYTLPGCAARQPPRHVMSACINARV